MQDEIRPKKVAIAKVKSEENVADLGTKPLSKAVIAKHCLTLGYVNMAEEKGQCKVQGVAMFWDFGSIQMLVTGVRTVSTQNTAGDRFHIESPAQTAATDAAAAASGHRTGDQ